MPIDRSLTLANWLLPPYNRQGFQRVRELIPTARIARDEEREPTPLPADPQDLDGLRVAAPGGGSTTLAELLEQTYTDGWLVVRGGVVVDERYLNGLTPRTPHLLMSISKSYCGALAGVLAGRGLLAPDDVVGDLAPWLRATSFGDATVRQLLDMTTGTDCPEDYENAYAAPDGDHPLIVYERQSGYRPLGGAEPIGIVGHLRTLGNDRRHGEGFEYRSVITNVLAMVCEAVTDTAYPELLARELWAPLGPERDAEIMLDPLGFPPVEGGMCTTLRDLARFGLAYLRDGRVGDTQLIPQVWIDDTRNGDQRALDDFARSRDGWPGGMYRNAFWVYEPGRRYSGLGIHGQMIYVDRGRDLVLARLATEPEAVHDERLRLMIGAVEAIDDAVR